MKHERKPWERDLNVLTDDCDRGLYIVFTQQELNYIKAKLANTVEIDNNHNETLLAKIKEAEEVADAEYTRQMIKESQWNEPD